MIPFIEAAEVARLLPPAAAVAAIEAALRGGLEPAAGVPRTSVPLPAGELLLMPAWSASYAGVKLAAVAPGNAARGLPRINAVYVLFDGATLRPLAFLDGAALTTLRTPAVSVAAVRGLLAGRPLRVVVFGAGPQGVGHLATLAAVGELSGVEVVVRSPDAVDRAALASAAGSEVRVLRSGAAEVTAAVGAADVVVCATTARTPLFDSALLRERVVVLAVGSHEPAAREVDSALCRRATVIVEDVTTALRECGDVVLAIEEGALTPDRLVPLREVVRGVTPVRTGAVLFKGSGMAWQDLVVAEAVLAGRAAAGRAG
jgi:ornithine cyclodeaminase